MTCGKTFQAPSYILEGSDTEGGRGLGTKEAMIDVLLVVYAGAVSS